MNTAAIKAVKQFQKRYGVNRLSTTILDVGSMKVNGKISGRDLWTGNYTGLDIAPGPNVDIIAKKGQVIFDWKTKFGGAVMLHPRVQVLRTIVSSQDRPSAPRKPPKNLNARR